MCLTCHASHGSANAGMTRRTGSAICSGCHSLKSPAITAKHPGMALESVNCVSCHDPHVQPKGKSGLIGQFPHLPFLRGECTSCHTVRGSKTLIAKGAELCFKCHEDAAGWVKRKHLHAPLGSEQQCVACHAPHAGAGQPLLKVADAQLCYGCHSHKQFEGKVVHQALEGGCETCHDPHGSDGPALLKAADVASLCQTCHTDLSQHYHPTTSEKPDPRTGRPLTCTSCHLPHASEIEGLLIAEPKRELCIQCHDPSMVPPRKR
jgi:predicted CXXCH cytochrome family protein